MKYSAVVGITVMYRGVCYGFEPVQLAGYQLLYHGC